jgi:hypothetical protein
VIYAFDRPHKTGTVCMFPCRQCGDDPLDYAESEMTDGRAVPIPIQPLFIIREATRKEYEECCAAAGIREQWRFASDRHVYYEVSTD